MYIVKNIGIQLRNTMNSMTGKTGRLNVHNIEKICEFRHIRLGTQINRMDAIAKLGQIAYTIKWVTFE